MGYNKEIANPNPNGLHRQSIGGHRRSPFFDSNPMASSSTSSSGSTQADSYVGCLISLTSMSEIRYQGVIVSVDPNASTISLKNVRSFGTEGRKENGPQVPPTEKLYGYVLFRGSEIKDLQVLTSAPFKPQDYDDPVQSHHSSTTDRGQTDSCSSYTQPTSTRPVVHDALATHQSMVEPMPVPRHSFAVPQPAHHRESTTTQFQEQHYQSTSAVQAPPTLQSQWPYPFEQTSVDSNSPSFPKYPDSLAPSPSGVPPQVTDFTDEVSFSSYMVSNNIGPHSSGVPAPFTQHTGNLAYNSGPSVTCATVLEPDHFIQSRSTASSSNQAVYSKRKDNEALLSLPPKRHPSTPSFPKAPLLHQPVSWQQQQSGSQFDEEFDFAAMNEKFKKDELWGSLGRAKHAEERHDAPVDNAPGETVVWKGDSEDASIYDRKAFYNKDEFFDTLSCDSLNHRGWNGWARYSQRMRLDTETFGDLQPSGHGNVGASGGNFGGDYYNQGRGRGNYRDQSDRGHPLS